MSTSGTGLLLFAHGSRIEPANEAVRAVARELAQKGGYGLVEAAFLELGQPDLAGAARTLRERGAERIVVIPYFLTLGMHLQRDLPKLLEEAQKESPDVPISMTPPLDGHPALLTAVLDRAAEALEGSRNESKTR